MANIFFMMMMAYAETRFRRVKEVLTGFKSMVSSLMGSSVRVKVHFDGFGYAHPSTRGVAEQNKKVSGYEKFMFAHNTLTYG